MSKHPGDLAWGGSNFQLICKLFEFLDRKVCVICNRITIRCTEKGLCDKCDEKKPAPGSIIRDLTPSQREKSTLELKEIQKTKFRLRRVVPRKLCTLWSDLVTDVALRMVDAKKKSEARKALRRYLMLKAVLIQPSRGGGCRRNRNLNLTERLMFFILER